MLRKWCCMSLLCHAKCHLNSNWPHIRAQHLSICVLSWVCGDEPWCRGARRCQLLSRWWWGEMAGVGSASGLGHMRSYPGHSQVLLQRAHQTPDANLLLHCVHLPPFSTLHCSCLWVSNPCKKKRLPRKWNLVKSNSAKSNHSKNNNACKWYRHWHYTRTTVTLQYTKTELFSSKQIFQH